LLGISKRSNTYLRTLLVHGARAILRAAKNGAGEIAFTAGLNASAPKTRKYHSVGNRQ
jgi:hypothetical protein